MQQGVSKCCRSLPGLVYRQSSPGQANLIGNQSQENSNDCDEVGVDVFCGRRKWKVNKFQTAQEQPASLVEVCFDDRDRPPCGSWTRVPFPRLISSFS